MVNDCGSPPMSSRNSTVLDWDPRSFTIRCPGVDVDCRPFDPKTNPRLTGTTTRTIINHTDAADPQSWLSVSPIFNARADDGSSLPVKVVTFWDFAIVE